QAVRRAAAVAIPPMMLMGLILVIGVRSLERRSPALQSPTSDRPLLRLGRGRRVASLAVAMIVIGSIAVPLASLVLRLGLAGVPPHWTAKTAWSVLRTTWVAHASTVLASIAVAAAVGLVAAALA